MATAETYMLRCLELAANGLGRVAPNPMVGCVIVSEGKIIGEGFHQQFGKAHAEVNAIDQVIEKHGAEILKNSKLHVSLEPCSHSGKTPPCADLIIDKKIPEVLIGCNDPFEGVNGEGIRRLKDAGVRVQTGILEKECRELNKRFLTFHERKRPYIILKWAQTMDGYIAPIKQTEENRWISNTYSRKLTHQWRSEEQAILVGVKTVHVDNPELTVREWPGKNPIRIVLDPLNALSGNAKVLNDSSPTLVFSETKSQVIHSAEWLAIDFSKNPLQQILDELYKRNIQSMVVEGGAVTLQGFINDGFWDEARIFIADHFLNDGVKAPRIDFSKKRKEELILNDKLFVLTNN